MKLYYTPGACSLAAHIALEEAGADYEAVKVDLATHKTEDGRDFYEISPRGYVPVIETDAGHLTENPAVLTLLAEQSGSAPAGHDRYKMLEWLGFIGTELHSEFGPVFAAKKGGDAKAGEEAKPKVAERLRLAGQLLGDREWTIGDSPTVADNYLFVMTLWADQFGIELPQSLKAFQNRNMQRDSVQKAMQAEGLT